MNIVYRCCKALIENRRLDGMPQKLEVFRRANKISEAQYVELIAMLEE